MHLINIIKYVLLALAIGLTAWLLLSRKESYSAVSIETAAIEEVKPTWEKNLTGKTAKQIPAATLLTQPRFTGRDKNGRKWLIEAESASQSNAMDQEEQAQVRLNSVRAKLNFPNLADITIAAEQGILRNNQENIRLNRNVTVGFQGFTLAAPTLSANLTANSVNSENVTIAGMLGGTTALTLTADTLSINQTPTKGQRIVFAGRVKGVLITP